MLMPAEQPLRLALLVPDLRGGGVERVRLRLARQFLAMGLAVDLVLMRRSGELLDEAPPEVRIVDLAAPRVRNLFPALVRYLRRARPDALLAAMWPMTSLAILADRLAGAGTRIIVSEHTTLLSQNAHRGRLYLQIMRQVIRATYGHAHARVVVSEGIASEMALLSGLPRGSFEVIHNPVDVPEATLDSRPADDGLWGVPPGARILTIGRMKPAKNHALLIKAFARLRDPAARLAILGDGRSEAATRALVAGMGLDDRVHMPGFVADPGPWLRSADLFVLSSDYEGFGNVLVEALGAGLPIVSTDCPTGPAEILENGRHGRLVPVGDEAALADAMAEALAEEHDRAALRRRAADFAPEIAARRYAALLFPDRVWSLPA